MAGACSGTYVLIRVPGRSAHLVSSAGVEDIESTRPEGGLPESSHHPAKKSFFFTVGELKPQNKLHVTHPSVKGQGWNPNCVSPAFKTEFSNEHRTWWC